LHRPHSGDSAADPHETNQTKESDHDDDLGVWTAEDSALVLIAYQNEMFEVIRSETNADLVERHVRLLAKTATAFGMPIVLSTVGVE